MHQIIRLLFSSLQIISTIYEELNQNSLSFPDNLEIHAFLRIKEPYLNGTVLNTADPYIKMGIENKSSVIYQEMKYIIGKEVCFQEWLPRDLEYLH